MAKLAFSKQLLLSLIAICIILIHISAFAEYRAFELEIQNQETGATKTVITTFDHFQYAQMHPIQPTEVILYKTSWMCWENTSKRSICPRPTNE